MQIVSLQAMSKDELIALLLKERQEHEDVLEAIGAGGVNGRRIFIGFDWAGADFDRQYMCEFKPSHYDVSDGGDGL